MLSDDERADLLRRANAAAAVHTPGVHTVYHFSDDGTIRRFAPHVPPTNPSHPPAVWAIDSEHAPLYWFPRHCPRISVWANDAEQQQRLTEVFAAESSRICAAETGWLDRMRSARLYRYAFDARAFEPWSMADGQYISTDVVRPLAVDPIDDVLGLHAAADHELRFTPLLGALMDRVLQSGLPFSFVRIRDARR